MILKEEFGLLHWVGDGEKDEYYKNIKIVKSPLLYNFYYDGSFLHRDAIDLLSYDTLHRCDEITFRMTETLNFILDYLNDKNVVYLYSITFNSPNKISYRGYICRNKEMYPNILHIRNNMLKENLEEILN